MANDYETGKVTILSSEEETTVSFTNSYSQTPVIKITSDSCENIFITETSTSNFKINKSSSNEINVHYVVISR